MGATIADTWPEFAAALARLGCYRRARAMRAIRAAVASCVVALVACGDNQSAMIDAAILPDGDPPPACSDGQDNDGDGKIDYPADPGCPAPQADDEGDPCPDG